MLDDFKRWVLVPAFVLAFLLGISGCNSGDIFDAIKTGDNQALQKAIANGADPNQPNSEGLSPLLVAINSNNPAAVGLLVDQGAQVDSALIGAAVANIKSLGLNPPDFLIQITDPLEPSFLVLGALMRSYRSTLGTRMEGLWSLSSAIIDEGFHPEKGFQMRRVLVVEVDGEMLPIKLSVVETGLSETEKAVGISAREFRFAMGEDYHIEGFVVDGVLEVTQFEKKELPDESAGFYVGSLYDWLPSTLNVLREHWDSTN